MNMQNLADEMSKGWRAERGLEQLTLEYAILELDKARDVPVVFDVGGSPCDPDSYRGYYCDLSFDSQDVTVGALAFRDMLKESLGKTFQGYKGGDYIMDKHTPLWRAEYGCCGRKMISLSVMKHKVVIVTAEED